MLDKNKKLSELFSLDLCVDYQLVLVGHLMSGQMQERKQAYSQRRLSEALKVQVIVRSYEWTSCRIQALLESEVALDIHHLVKQLPLDRTFGKPASFGSSTYSISSSYVRFRYSARYVLLNERS